MPYVYGLLAALGGVAAGLHMPMDYWPIGIIGCILLIVGIIARQRNIIMAVAIFTVLMVRTQQIVPPPSFQPQSLSGHKVTVLGRVSTPPEERAHSLSLLLDHVTVSGYAGQWFGRIVVPAPLFTEAKYGDVIEVSGKMTITEPDKDSYQAYLYNHQIYATIEWPEVSQTGRQQGNIVMTQLLRFRQLCQSAIIRALPRDEAGLLLGITLGLDQPLSEQFEDALRQTSTTHIIVASGYNASIIIALALGLTQRFGRRPSMAISLILLVAYVAFSGGNPSMIRAAVMATIVAIGQLVGRQRLALHVLYVTALTMLSINPMWLFDTSFQLSIAATTGIIEIEPIISSAFYKWPDIMRETVSTTLAAQLATLPIIAVTFGQVSLLGSVANLLILWLIPWVMLTGAVAIPILLLWPHLASIIAWPVEPALWYIKHVIEATANIPLASISVNVSLGGAIAYYLVLIWWKRGRIATANLSQG